MSIALMTLAWKSAAPAGQKMVLLALCDNANDQGECYPSITMLAEKCSMGARTVQQHITDMEALGVVKREMRYGRSTIYHIDPRRFCTPADSAPRRIRTPQNSHPTPADSAPITVIESSIESSVNQKPKRTKPEPKFSPLDALIALAVPQQVAEDWLTIRKAKNAPLTATALADLQAEAAKAGMPAVDAVKLCVVRSWQGFKAAWLARDSAPASSGPGGRFNPGAHVNRNRRGGPA